jgi:hypothetical protein
MIRKYELVIHLFWQWGIRICRGRRRDEELAKCRSKLL